MRLWVTEMGAYPAGPSAKHVHEGLPRRAHVQLPWRLAAHGRLAGFARMDYSKVLKLSSTQINPRANVGVVLTSVRRLLPLTHVHLAHTCLAFSPSRRRPRRHRRHHLASLTPVLTFACPGWRFDPGPLLWTWLEALFYSLLDLLLATISQLDMLTPQVTLCL